MSSRVVKVVIDARFIPGSTGGIETFVVGLAQGFCALRQSEAKVTFVTFDGSDDWVQPYLGGAVDAVRVEPPTPVAAPERVIRSIPRLSSVRRWRNSFGVLPRHERLLDRLGADVVHFPFQRGGRVRTPFIYQPHDLQHRHLPEYFTPRVRATREIVYGHLCRRAAAVAVGTSWVRDDVIQQLGTPPERVFVIPLAPVAAPAGADDQLPAELPGKYAHYPAASWPHKNHAQLFQALRILRGRGVDIPVILCGPRPPGVDLPLLGRAAGVHDLVHDLGYVGRGLVDAVTRAATLMVVPTLFESASFPIWEAFRHGVPVASSNVTSLPAQIGDAGLIFDPQSAEDMAGCMERLWTDAELRQRLVVAGRSRLQDFSWERTAAGFVALYRLVAGHEPVTARERQLLTTGGGIL